MIIPVDVEFQNLNKAKTVKIICHSPNFVANRIKALTHPYL